MTLHQPVIREPGTDPIAAPSRPSRDEEPVRRPAPRRGLRRLGRPGRLRRLRRVAFGAAVLAVVAYLTQHVPADSLALADLIWTAGVLLIVVTAGYLVLRRQGMVAFTLAVLLIGAGLWVLSPRASSHRSGDPGILRHVDMFTGFHDVSAAVIDLNQPQPVRFANLGSTPSTRFEIGSISKALTGMVIADGVRRGELVLNSPAARYLPALAGSPVGAVSLQDLVTHRSGLAQFAPATMHRALWAAPLGRGFLTENTGQLVRELRADRLTTRGTYAYSTLGAATAGLAASAAAGMPYPQLMQARLFGPLGMTRTAVQARPLVAGGHAAMGRPIQPWTMDAYAPGGGVVSTSQDLAALAVAVLQGRAPGIQALTPTSATAQSYTRIGMFWVTNHWDNGMVVTWHSGETAGYSAWIGFDRQRQRAAIVLGDTAKPVDSLGEMLLIDRSLG
jgi:CubicO group peptidase (beta-lactamase class C family)